MVVVKASGSINIWHLVVAVIAIVSGIFAVRYELATDMAILQHGQEANQRALQRHEAVLDKIASDSHRWQVQMNEKLSDIRVLMEKKQDR